MSDEIKEETLQMQPDKSLIPENVNPKAREEGKAAQDDNRMTMSGPSMRPRPKPKLELTPNQIKAKKIVNERSHQLTRQLIVAHRWRMDAKVMQRVRNTLSNDSILRNAVFTFVKGRDIPFVTLDPKTQLHIVNRVNKILHTMARNVNNAMQASKPDPTNATDLNNPANPNNLINQQQQAIQQGIVQAMNLNVAEEDMAENNTAAIILTATQESEITEHNQKEYTFNPSPKPGKQLDDKEIKEGEKTFVEDSAARETLLHRGEKTALEGFRKGDMHAFMKGAKGIVSKGVSKAVEKAGMQIALSMMKAG